MTTELETEAEKMRRMPGIYFMQEPLGWVPHVAGTGLQVYEIVIMYREFGWDRKQLRQYFDWLTEDQLNAAIAYYEAYPDEIDDRMRLDDEITPETLYERYPFMKPRVQA